MARTAMTAATSGTTSSSNSKEELIHSPWNLACSRSCSRAARSPRRTVPQIASSSAARPGPQREPSGGAGGAARLAATAAADAALLAVVLEAVIWCSSLGSKGARYRSEVPWIRLAHWPQGGVGTQRPWLVPPWMQWPVGEKLGSCLVGGTAARLAASFAQARPGARSATHRVHRLPLQASVGGPMQAPHRMRVQRQPHAGALPPRT
mmetsp:Transcript_35119/g.111649  ORF Transcript_35119/g.111649 Transcript_35119/m.111649 type:complete len:207 (-) Transcript_35119:2-622(-)